MPGIALAVLAAYFAVAFGLRSWLHWRRTGSTGFRGISGRVGSVEWLAGVAFVAALALTVLAPVAELAGVVAPWSALATPAVRGIGLVLAASGLAATLWSQLAMGDSWRIGVDARERTALVDRGPFRVVRNPIFTSMVIGLAGIALLVPNPVAAFALAALIAALELHVRLVEEPYLLRTHGGAYRRYAGRTGRFVPGIGHLDVRGAP
jgi:protein-S-isoprenylcysteine O-methyltransferase Ste14